METSGRAGATPAKASRGTGPTPVQAQAAWRVTVKALKVDDARSRVFVSSDQFPQPIQEDESTHLY